MLLNSIAWMKAVYTTEILALLQLIGLDYGGTVACQIAVPETPASFRACVCGLRFGCLLRLCLCADIYLGGRSFRSELLHWLTTMECPGVGLALIVLSVKSPLADHHGACARLSSLGSLPVPSLC